MVLAYWRLAIRRRKMEENDCKEVLGWKEEKP
jgi:hypothetical protein